MAARSPGGAALPGPARGYPGLFAEAGETGGRAHPDRLGGPGPGSDHHSPESSWIKQRRRPRRRLPRG